MPTPVSAFLDVAARHGGVDPEDLEAVEQWYLKVVPGLPPGEVDTILEALLAEDALPDTKEIVARYPSNAPVPSLSASPEAKTPGLAESVQGLISSLLSRTPHSKD